MQPRKFVYTSSPFISTIPIDSYHNSVPNAEGGGYVGAKEGNLVLYGKSEHFGFPDFDLVREKLKESDLLSLQSLIRMYNIKRIYFSRCSTLEEALEDIETTEQDPEFIISL